MCLPDKTPLASERAPTLQGTLSHCPEAPLKRIVAKAKCPPSSLATLTVKYTARPLYAAIIEYASLSAPPTPGTFNPLLVSEVEEDKGASEDDDIDDDDLHWERVMRASVKGSALPPRSGSGLRKRRVQVPRYELGLGDSAVVWPPPPHLRAEFLRAQRELGRRTRKSAVPSGDKGPVESEKERVCDSAPLEGYADGQQLCESTSVIYLVHFSVGEPKEVKYDGLFTYQELLLLSAEGPEALRRFSDQVLKWHTDKDYYDGNGTKFALHRFKMDKCGGGWWEGEGLKHARPLSSVILREGQADAIVNDVRNFIRPETKKWYLSHGLPHRRSYLFYGPPGTGKTSTIRVIASMFGLNCCYLSMVNKDFSNQVLGDALSQIPANALIVLEDVDALFNEDRKNEQGNSLTFSGLLNAMDGLISSDGVITIMTTNHMERLDKALVRGGRVDRRFHFAKPTDQQIENLFRSFYPKATSEVARNFLKAIRRRPEGDEARAISTLQQLFIEKRDSSDKECVAAVPAFFETHFPRVGEKEVDEN